MARERVEIYYDPKRGGLYAPDPTPPHPLELEQPKVQRHKPSYTTAILSRALKLDGVSGKRRSKIINQAYLAIIRSGEMVNNQELALLRRFARRHPDLVDPGELSERHHEVKVRLNKIDLKSLLAIDRRLPFTLEYPLMMGLFRNNAEALKQIVHHLSGISRQDLIVGFSNKNKEPVEYSDWDSYLETAFTFEKLTLKYRKNEEARFSHDTRGLEPDRFIRMDEYYELKRNILIPVAWAKYSQADQILLEVDLSPSAIMDGYYFESLRQNRFNPQVFQGAKLYVSWEGKVASKDQVAGIINKTFNQCTR
jgi:hypothetical protein